MNFDILKNEIQYKAIRSSGAGGQHVNKVSSKIELSFNVILSNGLSEREKELVLKKLSNKISKENILVLTCQESRSQHRNKEIVVQRFFQLLKEAVIRKKFRVKTKPTQSSLKKKAETKKKHGLKKALRKKPSID